MPRKSTPLTLEFVLLGLVNESPAHGYDLHKKLAGLEGLSLIWHVKQSRLYALLDKLESLGLLVSRQVSGGSLPVKKEYYITEPGRQRFASWMSSPVERSRDIRQEFLARLYFAQKAGIETAEGLLQRQKELCLVWLQSITSRFDELDESNNFEQVVFQYRIAQIEAVLNWLDYCQTQQKAKL